MWTTPSQSNSFVLAEVLVVGAWFALALVAATVYEVRDWPVARANRRAARQARPALASGRALPIPPLPRRPVAAQPRALEDVRRRTQLMIAVPWGAQVSIGDAEVRAIFDRTVAQLRLFRGNFQQAAEPVHSFASMPAPWCYVGAAELMFRLAYLLSRVWSPYGLRQGLRFVALAQQADPANADALVVRAKLLAAGGDPRWMESAAQTFEQLRASAPEHPRLPNVAAFLCWQAGDFAQAMEYTEREIARPSSHEDQLAARADQASLLWMLKRHEESIAAYKALLQEDDSDPWQWHNLSILLAYLKRYDEALAANQRALALMNFAVAADFGADLRARMARMATTKEKETR
jgi:tetratricopeptide (TPR) repeat protein